ncbi:MAG: alpha/beta hydrolase [bacterium]|nr:alpha/beta hydrolase [bacterium]
MPLIKINNCDIYYETHGQGAPLVFLHGLGSCLEDWEFQTKELSKFFKVIVLDFRGHGRSHKGEEEYSISLFASDIKEFTKTILGTPTHLIGVSMGGMVAMEVAATYPETVASITVINSIVELKPKGISQWIKFSYRICLMKILSMKSFAKIMSNNLFPNPEQADIQKIFYERFLKNNKKSYLKTFYCMLNWSIVDRLSKITCPALIVSGDKDYTSVSYKAWYSKKMQSAQVVEIKDSRHVTPVDQSEKLNKEILNFIRLKQPNAELGV